jgi:hypothetical protein
MEFDVIHHIRVHGHSDMVSLIAGIVTIQVPIPDDHKFIECLHGVVNIKRHPQLRRGPMT